MTSMTDKIASPRRRSWPDYDPKAPGSPWGPVQAMYDHPTLRGVRVVMTAGHGGLGVADGIARKVLSPAAYKLGEKSNGYVWYEEDAAVAIPLFEHPEWYPLLFGRAFNDAQIAQNERSLRQYYPRYFKMKEEGVTLLPKLSIGDTLTIVKEISLSRGAPLRVGETVSVVKLTADKVYVVRGGTGSQIRLPISYYESGSELGVGEGKVFLAKLASDKEAMRGRFSLPRGSYLPKDNATLQERKGTPEGLQIWTWEDLRRGETVYVAGAWAGKADKPLWFYNYRDVNQQERQIQDTIKNYLALVEAKRKRLEERKNFAHGLQVGDILVASWGYDQTNIDYYQVTKLLGKAIGVREIGKNLLKSDGYGSDLVTPSPGHFTGPEMKKIPQGGYGGSAYVKIDSSRSAHKWDGQPDRQTSSGWGH